MLKDNQYLGRPFQPSEIPHEYGSDVHLISDPYLFTLLARLCAPSCHQPTVNQLIDTLYRNLLTYAINKELPKTQAEIKTRMADLHPEGNFDAEVIHPKTRGVCVNLARAGTFPSQICFDALNYLLDPEGLRQDHISINRKTDDNEKVVGTNIGGVKIGGDVQDAYVFFPDPMGATGSTILSALEIYDSAGGQAKKYIALHLIVTPEYLKALKGQLGNLSIYALRLDRGLSSGKVLASVPGSDWDNEKGLNEKQYIVPGAGGVGEIINNSYV